MNRQKIAILFFSIIIVALLIGGCGSAKTLELADMNAWRVTYNDQHANARITFSPEDKCSLDILHPIGGGPSTTYPTYVYEVVVNDQTYQNYAVATVLLDEGKTLQDMENFDKTAVGKVSPPSFSALQTMDIVPPMSRTWHAMLMPDTPIYFVCIIQGPDDQRAIEEFGPVDVKQ